MLFSTCVCMCVGVQLLLLIKEFVLKVKIFGLTCFLLLRLMTTFGEGGSIGVIGVGFRKDGQEDYSHNFVKCHFLLVSFF